MLALCALTLSLVGLRSAAQPGPKVAVQYGFHDRWNGVHRLDGGVFPRSNSKELALGHQKMTKIFDAWIGEIIVYKRLTLHTTKNISAYRERLGNHYCTERHRLTRAVRASRPSERARFSNAPHNKTRSKKNTQGD